MLVSTPLPVSTHYYTNTAEKTEKGKQWGLQIIAMVTQVSSNLHWWEFKKTCEADIDQNQVRLKEENYDKFYGELQYMSFLGPTVAIFSLYVKSKISTIL